MDLHYAWVDNNQGGDYFVVIGCRVALELKGNEWPIGVLHELPWTRHRLSGPDRVRAFGAWLEGLEQKDLRPLEAREFVSRLAVAPRGQLPPTPARPAYIYGHLPFSTVTLNDTVIYRWEAFPTSLRIKRPPVAGNTIEADTYAAPASEVPFAPTGFSAVGRFALPNLMPACYRWELQPDPGTSLECGASVPLYGQAGGGVEVRFPKRSLNRCPIADPVFLPPL
jgi:hypothetical protein